MADNEPAADDVPPPEIDREAFKQAQFAPTKKGTVQMTNQSEANR